MNPIKPYTPKNHIRIVTAASLFDGHDAAINIMRRILQSSGAEIIHLGHNRSVGDIVRAAIQEDVQGIALTSYQGGHNEFFKYMYDLLQAHGAGDIKIFGGGGGTILPAEIEQLEAYGITKIYTPDDGRVMGLQGMINHLLEACDFPIGKDLGDIYDKILTRDDHAIARMISGVENYPERHKKIVEKITREAGDKHIPVLGITGTGGAGKSSLVDELIRRFTLDFPDKSIGIISVDPTKRKSGGALLGDRIRMNAIDRPNVYMRSLATRQANLSVSKYVPVAVDILKVSSFDFIILETSGIGQSDTAIVDHCDVSMYVMTPEFGAATQLEKIDMLDFADIVAINKFDKRGADDALIAVQKQYMRNHQLWHANREDMPVFGTIASQFNDPGTNALYKRIIEVMDEKLGLKWKSTLPLIIDKSQKVYIIPPHRTRYLSEIKENNVAYDQWVEEQAEWARKWQHLLEAGKILEGQVDTTAIEEKAASVAFHISPENKLLISNWPEKKAKYDKDKVSYFVRNKEIQVDATVETLSHTKIKKVILPRTKDYGEILKWQLQENVPGEFPFTAGVFPFKRTGELPTRMFAGEGGPERTNKRFHYVSGEMPFKRLSTAFDSVTLYGEDPDERPDIYGKIGNSGVSISCLDDMKRLYSGFDLSSPKTSVSMTINGPAAQILAFFMNAAIDQNCEKYIREHKLEARVEKLLKKKYNDRGIPRPVYRADLPEGNDGLGLLLLGITGDEVLPPDVYKKIKAETIKIVRGTVQADILKEDQAQNTCIYSTEFSLRIMGDVQEYFITNGVRNFYSVSISGYHIAEAGANPITQVAFTLSNAFTYVEYYLARGMDINAFAPNLSFFFSNGMDAEYAVIGRVARRIWAKAMKLKYGANERAQKLKYHIQTSGRSLHAQEIDFNDIRTTLQALYAIYDNCNSLHTNAYDEAITTPTEESVRRAMAIQLIINFELGLAKNENPLQGSFIIEELTELVEAAILREFDRLTERGGVLGAMENMYQRNKIQEESLYYESLKNNGKLPIVGVNFFLSKEGSPFVLPGEVIRATEEEKKLQIEGIRQLHAVYKEKSSTSLQALMDAAVQNRNIFESLIEASKYCSLGQMTRALYTVGGQYRRNM